MNKKIVLLKKNQRLIIILTILSVLAVIIFYTIPKLSLCSQLLSGKYSCKGGDHPGFIYQKTSIYSLALILFGGLMFFFLEDISKKLKQILNLKGIFLFILILISIIIILSIYDFHHPLIPAEKVNPYDRFIIKNK